MKKIFLVLAVLLVLAPAVFAGGRSETTTDSVTEWGSISSFVNKVSVIFDYATTEICIAITPFPSVLNAFTDTETSESYFSNSSVLVNRKLSEIKDSEYLLTSSERNSFSETDLKSIFDVGGDLKRGLNQENRIWGMVSYLFAIFTVLEVLYVTIRGYLVDEDNLVRKVVTRLIVTGILFLVLMALPALVELFRIGFFQMADIVSTPLTFTEITGAKSVFQLPGGVMRCTSKLLEQMTPDALGWNLDKNIKDISGWDSFADWARCGFFKLLYFVLNIYVMILSLLSAFQVMMNVIEVYILLAVVMCLVPFQVFTGTRYLVGENMIKSLFSNVIELFVIMIIIGATSNAAVTIGKYGVAYLTNPGYYPVVITLDTSKLGEELSKSKFAASTDPNKGLSIAFSTTYAATANSWPDSEVYGAYSLHSTNPGIAATMREMMEMFKSQYYSEISLNDVNSIDKYMLPLKAYLYNGNSESIPEGKVYSTSMAAHKADAYTISTLLKGIVDNDALNLKDSSSGGSGGSSDTSETTSNYLRETFYDGFLRKVEENLRSNAESNYFWSGSIQGNVSFDTANPVWVKDEEFSNEYLYGKEMESVTVKVPVSAIKITMAGLLGDSVDNSYNGNKAIDDALKEYFDMILPAIATTRSWARDTSWDNLSFLEKTELLSLVNSALGNTITISNDTEFLTSANLNHEATKPTFGLLIKHFFICLLAAFMQIYFIKKSSSVTNALQSGNVSMDRTQALERRVMAAAGFAATAPVKAAVGALTNHAKDDRKAPLNDAR